MDPRVQEEKEEGEGAETGSERGRQKKKGKGKRKETWGLRDPKRVGVDHKFCNLWLPTWGFSIGMLAAAAALHTLSSSNMNMDKT